MFSWLQTFVAPFVVAFGGKFMHDTVAMVLPPTVTPIDISYVPDPDVKSLIIGVTFGTPREYDPYTGEVGAEILSDDVGLYHATFGWMEWHWDPFVESILKTNPYPQLLWVSRDKQYVMKMVNNTGKFIWLEGTFWYIKFPKTIKCPFYGTCDPEDLFIKYMRGITFLFTGIDYFAEEMTESPEKMKAVAEAIVKQALKISEKMR